MNTIIDPKCLNCGHLWSVHFVNDPDSRCSLHTTPAGAASWCNCDRFRGGCAKCNHPMEDHGGRYLGMCHHVGGIGDLRCQCEGYEHMDPRMEPRR